MFDGKYTPLVDQMPEKYTKKYWSGTPVGCAICKRGNVTLLKRDGKRICRDCNAMMQRAKGQRGEKP
ncbi:MAG: hypothetical protein IJ206_09315 [Oscillospiraceae bacterium]|nr:hypothetical protein [Oscillospiraceae bacterium]